ncbi:MAG: hypothetical protein AAF804_05885, partial [Bacteroidota bacterium]
MKPQTKQALIEALNPTEVPSKNIPEFTDPDAKEVFDAFQKIRQRLVANLVLEMRTPSLHVIALLRLLEESLAPDQLDAEQQSILSSALKTVESISDRLLELKILLNPG